MANKKAFVLRIDPEKLDAVEKWAGDEFRSVNGQLEWIIDRALRDSGRIKQISVNQEKEDTNNEGS